MITSRQVITKPTDRLPERLRVDEAPAPEPGPGQIVVYRRSCAVNSVHLALITGASGPLSADRTARLEATGAAGTVIATGDGVTRFAVGDEVFGELHAPAGAWPPYVLTDADGPHVERRPEALGPADAAALVEDGLTAKTIVRAAGVQPGQTALVIGATGGVGVVLVPLLAAAGASVIATATPGDEEYVRSLGAAETLDDGGPDGMEALALHPDVDLFVDLVSFGEPYFVTAHGVPSSGSLVGSDPGPETDDGYELGIPRIRLTAGPGDLAELAQRALEDMVRAAGSEQAADGNGWVAAAA
jgi:NADPH2:quinone reductase